jgi:hypothetical protein
MTLRKREDTVILKLKHYISFCALGKRKKDNTAVNLSFKFTHARNQYGIVTLLQNISPTNNLNGE